MSNSSQNVEFKLQVPSDWEELELDPKKSEAYVRNRVAGLIGAVPLLRPKRSELIALMNRSIRAARAAGVSYSASTFQPVSDGVLSAVLTVSIIPEPEHDDDVSALDAIAASLRENSDSFSADEYIDLSIADLPNVGRAVRSVGHRVTTQDSHSVTMAVMETMLPIDGRVIVVTGSTPQLSAEEPLFELFDLITSTLEVRLAS